MEIVRVPDHWNPGKTWVFKFYKDHHVYVNQEIKGLTFNRKFQRASMKLYHMKLYHMKLRETGIGFVDLGI